MSTGVPTIAQTITIGRAATYLMALDVINGNLFGSRIPNQTRPILLQMVTDALNWQYSGNPGDSTLRGTANYAIWLYGKYGQQYVGGQGGGTVIPIPSTSVPAPLNFYVSGTSPIVTGQSTITFRQFVGFTILFNRGGLAQGQGITDGFSSYFNWNEVTGVFSIVPAANAGELFQIIPTTL